MERGNDNISKSSGQKLTELTYKLNEMQVQKLEKGIFIRDSAATSHMASDMTGLYNLQKISGPVMIEMDKTSDAPIKDYWMSSVS